MLQRTDIVVLAHLMIFAMELRHSGIVQGASSSLSSAAFNKATVIFPVIAASARPSGENFTALAIRGPKLFMPVGTYILHRDASDNAIPSITYTVNRRQTARGILRKFQCGLADPQIRELIRRY